MNVYNKKSIFLIYFQVVHCLSAPPFLICKCLLTWPVEKLSTPSLPVVSDISPVLPPDYSLVTSYVPLPLHTCLPAIILHVESTTHLFVCPAANWEELNRFQAHLQSVAATIDQGINVKPVVGQLVMKISFAHRKSVHISIVVNIFIILMGFQVFS